MPYPPPPPTRSPEHRLDALRRADKWFLADGRGAIWAPPFPVWLREPGFWDPAHFFELSFGPLFTVALVNASGAELPLVQTRRDWRPDRLVCVYQTPDGTELTETKAVLPSGRFRSSWSWTGLKEPAFLVAFTAQPAGEGTSYNSADDGRSYRWTGQANARGGRSGPRPIEAGLSVDAPAGSRVTRAAQRCQSTISHPVWRLSPFQEVWLPGTGLADVPLEPGIDNGGLDWLAMSVGIDDVDGGGIAFEFAASAGETEHVDTGATASGEDHWHNHFAGYPVFECDDAYLERYFDYRVYGLHLCEVRGPAGNIQHPAVAEGIEYFHTPITYSGQCHMLETRWAHTPDIARGTLLNFLDHQKPDGSLHGRVYSSAMVNTDFYHANWGDALLAVDAVQPDDAFLRRCYDGLTRYFRWLMTERDPGGHGTVEVRNHFETGQEYMSRYQAVNANADADGWASRTRLMGVDATVYAYQLGLALQKVALRLGDDAAAAGYTEDLERIASAITDRMWDPDTGLYSDLEPTALTRTGVKAAVCFYPMLTDLPDADQVEAMLAHLENPEEFATPWPLPSSSLDDAKFDASARWQGKRHLCPWNGRVWPMTTSHVIEGLIRQSKRRDALPEALCRRCGELAGRWTVQYIHMMFHQRDLGRPNCFEHYNPFTGQPCEYRGIDDYQHSWVIDLLMTGVMGIRVDADAAGRARLTVDPLPMTIGKARVTGVMVRGEALTLERDGDTFVVECCGERYASTIGQPVSVTLPGVPTPMAEPVILDAGRSPKRVTQHAALTPTRPAE